MREMGTAKHANYTKKKIKGKVENSRNVLMGAD